MCEHSDEGKVRTEEDEDNGDGVGDGVGDGGEDGDGVEDNEDECENEDEDDSHGNEAEASQSSRKASRQRSGSALTARSPSHLMQASTRSPKKKKHRDWMTSTPYDESIPFSHCYRYTWAGSTLNELMAMWQAYRGPSDEV